MFQEKYIFDFWNNAAAAEEEMLNTVKSIPDGQIVMMAAHDTASPCGSSCQEALRLVGGQAQGLSFRGKVHLLGRKGLETVQRSLGHWQRVKTSSPAVLDSK